MQGWKNSGLTEKGKSNAAALGRSLRDTEFKKVYCSTQDLHEPVERDIHLAQEIVELTLRLLYYMFIRILREG